MIAFPDDLRRPKTWPQTGPGNSLDTSINQSQTANFSHCGALRNQLECASIERIAALITSAYHTNNSNEVDQLFNTCRLLWLDGAPGKGSFGERSMRATAIILQTESDPFTTPDLAKLAFINKWLSAMQESFLNSEYGVPCFAAAHDVSRALLEVAILLGESPQKKPYHLSFCETLTRLKENVFLCQGEFDIDPTLYDRLSNYVSLHLHVPRSISHKSLGRLNLFIELGRNLADADMSPAVLECTTKLLKLRIWSEQDFYLPAAYSKLAPHQQTDQFRATLDDVLDAGLETLKEFQEAGFGEYSKIWQQGIEIFPSGSFQWSLCLHGLLELSPIRYLPEISDLIDQIIVNPSPETIFAVLDIASESSRTEFLLEVLKLRSEPEKLLVIDCLRQIKDLLIDSKANALFSEDLDILPAINSLNNLISRIETKPQ